ncbi:RNA pseudouridine synthase 4, mitochondrial [Andrographis paniculata]|uniref:RNA pseudouridine synthase 4, mitochondrial n=1 Tax=Andrographis paniculata TaxID=175694 RepID=UPI0021E8CE3F|nr:RNA pseudouridine synthase 4, mitochondrial [Andrographis paniculata]
MMERIVLREVIRQWRQSAAATTFKGTSTFERKYCHLMSNADEGEISRKEYNHDRWLILPPFDPAFDGYLIEKKILGTSVNSNTTVLKWILKCCPQFPRSFVQKLFRLRQVRKECSKTEAKEQRPRRVGAKDLIDVGDRIFLPKSVDGKFASLTEEKQGSSDEKEMKYVRSLELYKDPAIIVINKPPGMPVQGGLGINKSLDELASNYLRYDYAESPRLVHRLDRDSSGVLVMGRTQQSATILHSIFRNKTSEASIDIPDTKEILQKRYLALVIGSPRRKEGVISMPLAKVVVGDGKSERITTADYSHKTSAQLAVTEYRVISSSPHGFTWLELFPHTGRKHQLRVHCAEVLGTPIVGDYKYGWKSHRKLGHTFYSEGKASKVRGGKWPDGLESESGSICDKQFRLHLHCKEIILPDISQQVNNMQGASIKLNAPISAHMQRSWDLMN